MKSREYEYISTIAREGNFSKAAQILFISQPALSTAVKKIERELYGIPLFDRSVNPVVLTEAGKYWLAQTEKICDVEQQIQEYFSAAAGIRHGNLAVGSSAYFCTYLLADLLREYQERNPSCQITLTECDVTSLEQGLRQGTLDLGIDVEEMDESLYNRYALGKEYLLLAVPSTFPVNAGLRTYQINREQIICRDFLRKEVPGVNLAVFAKEPFLLLKKNQDSYKRAMEMCHQAGFEPRVSLYLDQLVTAYNVARNGQNGCVFFRDTMICYGEPTDKLVYYKLDTPLAERKIWVSVKKAPKLPSLLRDFIRFIRIRCEQRALLDEK